MSGIQLTYKIEGFLKVYDPNNGEVFVDKHNAINYENMSEAIADTLSSRGYGEIYQMAFGNGGASVDETGVITYLPPNTTGQNAALYNRICHIKLPRYSVIYLKLSLSLSSFEF